jgi:hypothetical protein
MNFVCPDCGVGVVPLAGGKCPVCGFHFTFWSVLKLYVLRSGRFLQEWLKRGVNSATAKCPNCLQQAPLFARSCPHCKKASPAIAKARSWKQVVKEVYRRVRERPSAQVKLWAQRVHLLLGVGLFIGLLASLRGFLGSLQERNTEDRFLAVGVLAVLIAMTAILIYKCYPEKVRAIRRGASRLTKLALFFDLMAANLLTFVAILTWWTESLTLVGLIIATYVGGYVVLVHYFGAEDAAKARMDQDDPSKPQPFNHQQRQGRHGELD